VNTSDKDAIRIIVRQLMTPKMALEDYAAWKILFNAQYYLANAGLLPRMRGTVRRWWVKTYHEDPDRLTHRPLAKIHTPNGR
jgi:hypothetical protein